MIGTHHRPGHLAWRSPRIAVESGKFSLAWIGLLMNHHARWQPWCVRYTLANETSFDRQKFSKAATGKAIWDVYLHRDSERPR